MVYDISWLVLFLGHLTTSLHFHLLESLYYSFPGEPKPGNHMCRSEMWAMSAFWYMSWLIGVHILIVVTTIGICTIDTNGETEKTFGLAVHLDWLVAWTWWDNRIPNVCVDCEHGVPQKRRSWPFFRWHLVISIFLSVKLIRGRWVHDSPVTADTARGQLPK